MSATTGRLRGPRWIVLGCGPTGLIAAHALAAADESFLIFSKKGRSPMYGAQLLERPIPGISEDSPVAVVSTMNGDMSAYAAKVYANQPDKQTYSRPQDHMYRNADGHLEWVLKGWDIRDAYARLYDLYEDAIVPWMADHRSIAGLRLAYPAARFISTIPATMLCEGFCEFVGSPIWSSGTWENADDPTADNRVYFDVDPDPARWYRTARIHGWATTEWPDAPQQPHPDAMYITKPERTNCRCHPEIARMGRFGLWQSGVLAHQAWDQTNDLINQHREQESA